MSLLVALKAASFTYLLEKTGATKGNISIQLKKLSEAGYIEIEKSFQDNYPLTECSITKKGISAFEIYVNSLKDYLNTDNIK